MRVMFACQFLLKPMLLTCLSYLAYQIYQDVGLVYSVSSISRIVSSLVNYDLVLLWRFSRSVLTTRCGDVILEIRSMCEFSLYKYVGAGGTTPHPPFFSIRTPNSRNWRQHPII